PQMTGTARRGADSDEDITDSDGSTIEMETVFNISNCAIENQVKFANCTLHGVALTWWKSHVKTVGQDAAYDMPWNTLMKMITAKYYPQNEIKKLEMKIWELKVKESDKIEKYVGGLPDMIHESVMTSKPNIMQDVVEFATDLMDKKIRTFAEYQIENKRKFEDTSKNNQNQQQQNKRQNTGAYTAGPGEKKPNGRSKPLCSKCNYHHDGSCAPKCHKCNRVGHLARDCRSPANANTANNQRGTETDKKATCFEAIISDRGTHFCNDQFARVMTKYGFTHRLATAYHPQTSGQVKVSNRERTKKLHDFKIKNRIFNVGDQVLLFDSHLKIFSGKLKTRWSGPFTITQVFPYGTVELSQPDGPNFKVNGHRGKHYFGGDIPSKVVPDLHTIPMDK
nr:reverse transcriptase domain-containing protein [Tanacetum cinerariifolium]